MRLGDLVRAEDALHRALEVRSPIQFHETTGAVFDTLAQIHLIRGRYDTASDFLGRASEAYGAYGRQTSKWYEWSVRVLGARLALRRAALDDAVARVDEILQAGAPPFDALQATLIAAEALILGNQLPQAEQRLAAAADAVDPRIAPAAWGEFLRLRGALHAKSHGAAEAYHDFSQSAALLNLLGERYQSGLSHLALGRLVAETGARSVAERHLNKALGIFEQLGAERDLDDTRAAQSLLTTTGTGQYVISPADADDAVVRRIVDAAALPELLGRETASALLEAAAGDCAVVYVELDGGDVHVVACAGCEPDAGRAIARSAANGNAYGRGTIVVEPLGRDPDGPRWALVASPRPIGHPVMRRLRMIGAVARQGFMLCAARDRPVPVTGLAIDPSLEPLIPGFLSASAAMARVMEQIQRLSGNDLTVLITGESGTGKELVARAIHAGSHRSAGTFLPYNCTTTGRDLADSQLFGHRRGSFTGAVSDQPGLVRTAVGGTLFLDEIGDLPLDVQPKLLRFLEQHEIMPIGETQAAARRRPRPGGDERGPRAARRGRKISRGPVLPLERHPHSRAAAARAARRDPAPQHLLPARSDRAPQQTRHPPELGNARRVFTVLVAGQRAAAEERDPACSGAQRARWECRAGALVARGRVDATLAGLRLNPDPAHDAEPRVGDRAYGTGSDSGRARPRRRQYLRDGAVAWAHSPRACT